MLADQKTAVVVGWRGFIGRHVEKLLRQKGWQIAEMPRVSGDDPDLPRCLEGCDALINCAGRVDQQKPDESWFANATLPVILRDAAVNAGVKRFVHLSSVASQPYLSTNVENALRASKQDAYGASKAVSEIALSKLDRRSDLTTIILRPPAVYGPGGSGPTAAMIRAAKKGIPLPFGDFSAIRSLISVYNIAHVLSVAATGEERSNPMHKGTSSYIIAESPPVSAACFYNTFCRAFGHPKRSFSTPGKLSALPAAIFRGPFARLTHDAVFEDARFEERFGPLPYDLKEAAAFTVNELTGRS